MVEIKPSSCDVSIWQWILLQFISTYVQWERDHDHESLSCVPTNTFTGDFSQFLLGLFPIFFHTFQDLCLEWNFIRGHSTTLWITINGWNIWRWSLMNVVKELNIVRSSNPHVYSIRCKWAKTLSISGFQEFTLLSQIFCSLAWSSRWCPSGDRK